MLDIKFIRENPEIVKKSIKDRRLRVDVDRLLELDRNRRQLQVQIDELKAALKKGSASKPSQEDIKKMRILGDEIKKFEQEYATVETDFLELLQEVPNITLPDVPVGNDENDNKVLRKWGKIPEFEFKPKDHIEIGKTLDIIDIEKAAEVAGARFAYLKGGAALLEFALINYVIDLLTDEKKLEQIANKIEKGYSAKPFVPVIPPVMIRPEVFRKMGRLTEEDKEERYYLPKDELYLIGSAEHTLGPLHMNETLDEKDLPVRYLGFSTSFRREAGSYGKDTRGILRVHQFDKLEMESFTLSENSVKEQEFIIAIQEHMMQELGLPYQVVIMCTGETSKPDARQIDIETWLPGQDKYRETHTSDLMTDFQARRLNIKVRRKDGQTEFVHMNDATAFAVGRTLIAILENNQRADGSLAIPKVLQEFVGRGKIGPPK